MNTPSEPSTQASGNCAVCDLTILLGAGTRETEVITCTDCKTRLVVEKIEGEHATLAQAPAVEEDWGQ
jgi:hypothetical protein